MTNPRQPTEPSLRPVNMQDGVPAPPKFLLWGVIILFVLIIVGFFTGIWAFNNVLTTGQQVRVINQFPFMESFQEKQPTPQGGILPTAEPDTTGGNDASNLLDMQLGGSRATATPTLEATQAGMLVPTNTPTVLPTATPTLVPTNTPVPTIAPTAASESNGSSETLQVSQEVVANIPSTHRNFGFSWELQTWNNCGPATITTALSYFGWTQNQEYAKDFLRFNREDKNVSPGELVDFVNEQSQVSSIVRIGGNLDILKGLIAAGFPVVIERGMQFEGYDWLGHYQALVAYDDGQGVFYAYDSFLGDGAGGEGEPMRYSELDNDWKAFNRLFIVMYQPDEAGQIQAILGDLFDADQAATIALETAQAEARADQTDGFAWHNMGSSLVALGRYQEAASAFDLARQAELPWRMLWYQFGMFEAYYNVGRYDDVVSLVQSNLNKAEEHEESYYWRGMALAAQGNESEAASNFRLALRFNPNYVAARTALDSLG